MSRIAPDLEYYAQAYAAQDTVAWDDVYERALGTARRTGYAQIILERGHARYRLVTFARTASCAIADCAAARFT